MSTRGHMRSMRCRVHIARRHTVKDVLLRACGVRKTLGKTLVLNDVSLEVCRGDVVGLLGANGAGKTTLIRIVMGLMAPDGGSVDGVATRHRGRAVGYLPE